MAVINILDSKIYNKIAAGEVVERPSSVVKELLDNSLDSGADDIKIEIKGGGLKSISVKDNGCGISKEYVKTAFMPHATSKISSEEDLAKITTLGFRGEALASIAAVSMVEISTSENDSIPGMFLMIKGGIYTEEKECSCPKGTYITVKNLFFNTPARLKFIKSERAEETDIINITSRYILCNPFIRIRLTCNDKTVYQSTGQGLKEALNCIYGKSILDNITEIEHKKDDMILKGYIGKTSFTKPNRSYQTIALNGRYIINNTISAAVANAYSDFLMKRQYPFYILHLSVPDNSIDVNVHPNKMDVRFEDNKKVFSLFYNSIYGTLHSTTQSIVHSYNAKNCGINNDIEDSKASQEYISSVINKYDRKNEGINIGNLKFNDIYNDDILKLYNDNNTDSVIKQADDNQADDKQAENTDFVYALQNENTGEEPFPEYELKCCLFNTYIIIEIKDNIYIIDQHAAHERILYDKFLNAFLNKQNAIQYLIVPYLLNVSTNEYDFLYNNIGLLGKLGFIIEIFGDNVFKISGVPLIFSQIDLNAFFNDVLKDIVSFKQINKVTDYIKEEIIKKACHAAVKAGDKLEKSDIDCILKQLFKEKVLLCPHGRPVVIKYGKQNFEKLFKRSV